MQSKFIINGTEIVPAEWVDGKENVTVTEWGQREYDSGLKMGVSIGINKVKDYVMEQALANFRAHNDNSAALLRKLAKEIENLL